jgi:hypothetical protein
VDELAQSAVVFDDIDNIKNNSQKEAVYNILNNMLHVGWHHHVTRVVKNAVTNEGPGDQENPQRGPCLRVLPQLGRR